MDKATTDVSVEAHSVHDALQHIYTEFQVAPPSAEEIERAQRDTAEYLSTMILELHHIAKSQQLSRLADKLESAYYIAGHIARPAV